MPSYSLFELNEYIRRVFTLNFQETIWVRCEIAQINASRGHFYFNLIEKATTDDAIIAQSDGILWARQYQQLHRKHKKILDQLLRNGVAVLLQVKIDFDERYGLKLLIEDIDPSYTVGQMELKRQAILEALVQRGLLNKNSQLPLPKVLQRIAIISSESAAGLHDYRNQLQTNAYGYQFQNQLFPAAMQGVNVEKEVLKQLKKIARLKDNFDAVVIIRGGGAKLDLAAFDNLAIGEAIANFPLPILVGIGHEIDETILDQVAHTSLKTPTAVAEFLINRALHFESAIIEYKNYILSSVHRLLQAENSRINHLQRMVQVVSTNQVQTASVTLGLLTKRLPQAVANRLSLEQKTLNQLEKICYLLAPETALKRGFSITTHHGKVVTNKNQVQKGATIVTQLLEGEIKSTVK